METISERQQNSYFRSKLSWTRVVRWAALFAVVLFLPADWRGCGFFRRGAAEFLDFVYVFAWFVIFFALRMRWRLLLLVVTLPMVLIFFGLHGIAEENAGPEAAAVRGLREIQSSLEKYGSGHEQQGYPKAMPSMTLSRVAEKFYRYEYVPSRDVDGKIVSYVVRATPRRRDCDFNVSFTITADGKVFYTYLPRAATTEDRVLE